MIKRFVDYATFNALLCDVTLGSTGVVGVGPAISPNWAHIPEENITSLIRYSMHEWTILHWGTYSRRAYRRRANDNYSGTDPIFRCFYCPKFQCKSRCLQCQPGRSKYLIRCSFLCNDYIYFFTIPTKHFELKYGPLVEFLEDYFDDDICIYMNSRRAGCMCYSIDVDSVVCILPQDGNRHNVRVDWNRLMHAINGNMKNIDPKYCEKREQQRQLNLKMVNKNNKQQRRKYYKNKRAALDDYIYWAAIYKDDYDFEEQRIGKFNKVEYRPKLTNNPLPPFKKVYEEGDLDSYEERMKVKEEKIATGPERKDVVIEIDDDVIILDEPVVSPNLLDKPIESMDVIIDIPMPEKPPEELVSIIKPSQLGTATNLTCRDARFNTEYKFAYEFRSSIHLLIQVMFKILEFFHTLRRITGHSFKYLYITIGITLISLSMIVTSIFCSYMTWKLALFSYLMFMSFLIIGFLSLLRYLNKDQVRVRKYRVNCAFDMMHVADYTDEGHEDHRRDVDTSFELKESSKIFTFREKKYDQIVLEDRDVFTGNWRVVRHYEYMLGTSTPLEFDKELLVQMLSPKNTLLTLSSEALLERLANSTNLGPFISYDRTMSLSGPVLENAAKLSSIIVLSSRSVNREINVYNELFQKGGEMRLTSLPNL